MGEFSHIKAWPFQKPHAHKSKPYIFQNACFYFILIFLAWYPTQVTQDNKSWQVFLLHTKALVQGQKGFIGESGEPSV